MIDTLKAYALDFGKAVIAGAVTAATAWIADADLAGIVGSFFAGGGLTALGPKNTERRKRAGRR